MLSAVTPDSDWRCMMDTTCRKEQLNSSFTSQAESQTRVRAHIRMATV